MGIPQQDDSLVSLVNILKEQRDWVREVNSLSQLMVKLNHLGKATSTRQIAKLIERSKSWVAISIILIRGLKVYPEIEKCDNRNEAYNYLKKKQKLRRFLES
jgi:uncharacterized protein YjiS (DUF1127 family)